MYPKRWHQFSCLQVINDGLAHFIHAMQVGIRLISLSLFYCLQPLDETPWSIILAQGVHLLGQ